MMKRFGVVLVVCLVTTVARAECYSDRCQPTAQIVTHVSKRVASHRGREETLLPHPAGCPRIAFCACGASVEIFGHSIRSLWPAAAWLRFPRTAPAPGMVAVRTHHLFVLRSLIGGSIWLAADYNSGGHRSRLHAQSIRGYSIVDPRGLKIVQRQQMILRAN